MSLDKPIFTHEEIAHTVYMLSQSLTSDYRNRDPLLLGVLKGAFVFLSDLVRQLDFPLEVGFVQCSSYRAGTKSTENVCLMLDSHSQLTDREVIVVEDIVDTGLTATAILEKIEEANPYSISLCTLLDKPQRRQVSLHINYRGFIVPNQFVVGYGLDFNEKYRNLPDLWSLKEE